MKKLLSLLLVCAFVLSMGFAYAEDATPHYYRGHI